MGGSKTSLDQSVLMKMVYCFNVGYIGTAILAVVFLALGALVQYGSPETVEMVGGKYIAQLINMYASTIG